MLHTNGIVFTWVLGRYGESKLQLSEFFLVLKFCKESYAEL